MEKETVHPPLAYLSGAIEGAPDEGKEWRQVVKEFLEDVLGHATFNPTENSRRLMTPEEFEHFRQWKIHDRDKFFPVIHRIIDYDLTTLRDKTDYVVCYWDEHVGRGAGTAGEISVAYLFKIPVYFITALDLEQVSSWAVGCSTELFFSFDEFFSFMKNKYQQS